MARTDVLTGIVPQRGKPAAGFDGNSAGMYLRGGRYGELQALSLVPTKHVLADEGSYFTAQNVTIGTAVAIDAAHTSFLNTNALFVLKNNAPVGSGIRVYLDFLRLLLGGTPPTATVSVDFVAVVDYVTRFPSTAANGTTMVPVNVNGDDGTASQLIPVGFNVNVMTIPIPSAAARIAARGHVAQGIGLVGDEIFLQFGATERSSSPALTAAKATAPGRYVADMAPVIFGPQQFCVIHRWSLTEATNAASYEYELGWWER